MHEEGDIVQNIVRARDDGNISGKWVNGTVVTRTRLFRKFAGNFCLAQ